MWQAGENYNSDDGEDNDVNQAGKHVASQRATILQMERTLFHIDQV